MPILGVVKPANNAQLNGPITETDRHEKEKKPKNSPLLDLGDM